MAVLQAIYAAYAEGWSDAQGADPDRVALAEEAVWLARVLAAQVPDEPEALGLLALMLHLEARRPARRVEGRFVPLDEQDVSLWRTEMQRSGAAAACAPRARTGSAASSSRPRSSPRMPRAVRAARRIGTRS